RTGSTIQPLSIEAVLPYLFPKGATLNISETLAKEIIEALRDQLWVLLANVTQLFQPSPGPSSSLLQADRSYVSIPGISLRILVWGIASEKTPR
ncbi:hypothetical protein H102_01575, partial [Trichophyton rubrum CBS 100081]